MLNRNFTVGFIVLAVALSIPHAALPDEQSIEKNANTIFKAFTKTHPISDPLEIVPTHALATQNYYIALLRPTWGMDVGYIANMSQAEVASGPLTGILLENMFTGTRAMVSRSYGVNMVAAGELMFRVKSQAINTATNRLEVLAALKSVIPTVRLSDALLSEENKLNDSTLMASNLCVRFCVLGGEVPLTADEAWIERLENVGLRLYDQDKQEIGVSEKQDRDIHPLDSILAIRDALASRGVVIKENELLAVGTLTEASSVDDLTRLSAVFTGLKPNENVQVYMGFQ